MKLQKVNNQQRNNTFIKYTRQGSYINEGKRITKINRTKKDRIRIGKAIKGIPSQMNNGKRNIKGQDIRGVTINSLISTVT